MTSTSSKGTIQRPVEATIDDWAWVDEVNLPPPPVGLDTTRRIRSIARHFKEQCNKLTTVREDVMRLREQGMFERDQCAHKRRHFAESQKAYLDQRRNIELASNASAAHPATLQQQLRDDLISLDAQDKQAFDVELELSQKEYDLYKKEIALVKASEELLVLLGPFDVSDTEEPERPASLFDVGMNRSGPTPAPSPPVPLALERYYEKKGAVGWIRDRLLDVQTEYQDSREDRLFRRDHEENLDISDEQFDAEYKKKLFDARTAVEEAIAEAEQARVACLEQGLDPDGHKQQHTREVPEISLQPITPEDETWNLPRHSPTPALESIFSDRNPSSTVLTTITGPMNLDAPLRKRPKRQSKHSRHRVQDWVNKSHSEEQYPFEEDRFEQNPVSRPITYCRRSIGDFKDLPVISADIEEKVPQQLREQSHSESNIFLKPGRRARIRHSQSLSESEVEEQRQRKDSHQESFSDVCRDLRSKR